MCSLGVRAFSSSILRLFKQSRFFGILASNQCIDIFTTNAHIYIYIHMLALCALNVALVKMLSSANFMKHVILKDTIEIYMLYGCTYMCTLANNIWKFLKWPTFFFGYFNQTSSTVAFIDLNDQIISDQIISL